MANNYTTTTPTTLEFSGDNVGAGTIPLTYDIVITPDANYTLQAADFSIGSTLPIEVTSVSFADTTTAYALGNLVVATVTLAQWYTMPATPDTIEVDIDGRALPFAQPRLSFTTTHNIVGGSMGRINTVSGATQVSSVTNDAGTMVTKEFYVDIPANSQALVARYIINSSTSDEGYYASAPQYKITSPNPSRWSSQVSSVLYGTSTDDQTASAKLGEITYYQIDFYYDMGDSAVPLSDGNSIAVTTVAPTVFGTPVVSLTKAKYDGYQNQGILPSRDIDLSLNVLGSPGATYDILVMDDNGLSYDFTSDTFTRALTKSSEQTINLGSPTITTRSNDHIITVPAYNEKAALAKSITTTITPTGETTTAHRITGGDPFVITLNQFGEVDFTIGVTPATYGVAATTETLLSFLNKKPLSYPTTFNPTDFPLLSTTNNSYFNISTPLSYTVNGTVSSHSHVSTSVVLTATSATLKLQTGDSVTGTGIDTATTITVDGTTTIVLSKNSTEAITGTLVFTRNVGISRQPLASDFFNATQGGSYKTNFDIQSIVTQATTNSTTVAVSVGDEVVSGHTVQGESIVGYPTVIGGGGSQNLVLSSSQTLPSGESLEFSNAMSDYEIVDVNVTGAGTSDCKLNVEGYVSRVGNADVINMLVLQNFITSYVKPVATAQAVDCPLGGGIKIFPLGTGHTGVLTIAEVASGGRPAADSATISDDGSYLLYLAPPSGSTETITYKVNDGINTSTAAADIVVTLT